MFRRCDFDISAGPFLLSRPRVKKQDRYHPILPIAAAARRDALQAAPLSAVEAAAAISRPFSGVSSVACDLRHPRSLGLISAGGPLKCNSDAFAITVSPMAAHAMPKNSGTRDVAGPGSMMR